MAIDDDNPRSDNSKRSAGIWRAIPWFLVLACTSGIAWLHWNAVNLDRALVNVATASNVLFIWILSCLGLWSSQLPRWMWRATGLVPLLALLAFFGWYKVERLDGELKPIFRPRWADAQPLQEVAGQATGIEPGKLLAGPSDFPQFLGPNRNGTVSGIEVDPNWTERPPEVLWKKPIGSGWSGFAIQGDVAVTMEQRDEQEWVSCYDMANGDLLWNYAIPGRHFNPLGGAGPRSTPTIADGKVYAASAVSRLVCLDLSNGQPRWEVELLELAGVSQAAFEAEVAWGRSASPLVYEGLVIVSLGGAGDSVQTLLALDAETGEQRWRVGTEQISYASPSIIRLSDQPQIAIIDERSLTAFDPISQQQLWTVPWPGASNGSASVSQPVQVDDSRILLTKGYGTGAQLISVRFVDGTWTPEVLWTAPTSLRTKFTSAVVSEGFAYGLSDGILECIDLETGRRRWKKGRYQQGQVLLVADKLLITAENGEIVLVAASPAGFEELAKLDVLGDVTWNTAALSGDRLLIRNSDEAACVRLPYLWLFEGSRR